MIVSVTIGRPKVVGAAGLSCLVCFIIQLVRFPGNILGFTLVCEANGLALRQGLSTEIQQLDGAHSGVGQGQPEFVRLVPNEHSRRA